MSNPREREVNFIVIALHYVKILGGCGGWKSRVFRNERSLHRKQVFLVLAAQPSTVLSIIYEDRREYCSN
jgi:hypothetical protein